MAELLSLPFAASSGCLATKSLCDGVELPFQRREHDGDKSWDGIKSASLYFENESKGEDCFFRQ